MKVLNSTDKDSQSLKTATRVVMERKDKNKTKLPRRPGIVMPWHGGRHCGYHHRQAHLNPVYSRRTYNLTSHQSTQTNEIRPRPKAGNTW